jgi:hypothetical protein
MVRVLACSTLDGGGEDTTQINLLDYWFAWALLRCDPGFEFPPWPVVL